MGIFRKVLARACTTPNIVLLTQTPEPFSNPEAKSKARRYRHQLRGDLGHAQHDAEPCALAKGKQRGVQEFGP